MTEKNKLTPKEALLIDNIINKLQMYMIKNNQTLYNLANTLGFAYQPFHRLIKNRNLPTISSLAAIANHLNCSIEELISEKIFLDIHVIKEIKYIHELNNYELVRVYINYKDYLPYIDKIFFAVQEKKSKISMLKHCKMYFLTDEIILDGTYIVKYNNVIDTVIVISVSTKFIVVLQDGQEIKIDRDKVQPLAKFFAELILLDMHNCTVYGVTK